MLLGFCFCWQALFISVNEKACLFRFPVQEVLEASGNLLKN